MTRDEFVSECRFAKIVDTDQGPGLLIAGHVLRVTGPDDYRIPTDPEQHASAAQRTSYTEWLVEALRNSVPVDPTMKAQGLVGSVKLAG